MLVNYLADALPVYRRLGIPFCRHCHARLNLINYFFWPRQCQSCHRKRGWRSWIVELVAVTTALWLWQRSPEAGEFLFGFILLSYFGVVLVIDLEHRLILHPVSIVGGILGLIVGTWKHNFFTTITGGLAGFVLMFGLFMLGGVFIKMVNRRARKAIDEVPLGFGDVTLATVLGLILGWPGIIPGLVLGIVLGGVVSSIYLVGTVLTHRYQPFSAIPYGPFLLTSTVILLFFKDPLIALLTP